MEENASYSVLPTRPDGSNVSVYSGYTERAVYAAIMAVVCVVGTVGNCMVIIAVFHCRKLRTKTNFMVVNLSVADLVSSVNLPWMCVAILSEDGWPLPQWICGFEGAIMVLTIGCSLYTLGGIAVNRCCAISMPSGRYHAIYRTTNIAVMIAFFWLVPMTVVGVGIAVFGTDFFGYAEEYSMCSYDTHHARIKLFNRIVMVAYYPIPLIAISVSSIVIWRYVHRQTKLITTIMSPEDSSPSAAHSTTKNMFYDRQLAVTKNLFLVISVFFMLVSPFSILLVYPGGDRLIPPFGVILLCNSCANPLIYALRHPDFKVVFRNLLRGRVARRKSSGSSGLTLKIWPSKASNANRTLSTEKP